MVKYFEFLICLLLLLVLMKRWTARANGCDSCRFACLSLISRRWEFKAEERSRTLDLTKVNRLDYGPEFSVSERTVKPRRTRVHWSLIENDYRRVVLLFWTPTEGFCQPKIKNSCLHHLSVVIVSFKSSACDRRISGKENDDRTIQVRGFPI